MDTTTEYGRLVVINYFHLAFFFFTFVGLIMLVMGIVLYNRYRKMSPLVHTPEWYRTKLATAKSKRLRNAGVGLFITFALFSGGTFYAKYVAAPFVVKYLGYFPSGDEYSDQDKVVDRYYKEKWGENWEQELYDE